jgi:Nucleoside-diphosphate-sugar epimerases
MDTSLSILVTGASGFIGAHLVAAFASRGYRVRALYRRSQPPAELLDAAAAYPGLVELFNADLGDAGRVAQAVAGMDAVVHAAALASDWGSLDLFIKANYDATVNLVEAAREAGARKFVYFSSAQVHGYGNHVDTTERGPYFPPKYPYQITKMMTEEYVLAQNSSSFKTTAVRPCNVYGPGDRLSTYTMFESCLSGIFGYIGNGSSLTCPVYIDDLCEGVALALESPESNGQAILITDGMKVSWNDYSRAIFAAVESKGRPVGLPKGIAYAAAGVMSAAAKLARSATRPPITAYVVEQGAHNFHFSNEKARDLLGFKPTIFYEQGLKLTAAAFLEERGRRAAFLAERERRLATKRGRR